MPNSSDAALALRLKALRLSGEAGHVLTQRELASVFGVKSPSISSWENTAAPVAPPTDRLRMYATFFATNRSFGGETPTILTESQLTTDERALRDELLNELIELREGMLAQPLQRRESAGYGLPGFWRFNDGHRILLVPSVPAAEFSTTPEHSDFDDGVYKSMYRFADLTALFELHGHLRASNPTVEVDIKPSAELKEDDFTAHLIVIGGVDWNPTFAEMIARLDFPVSQSEMLDDTGYIQVNGDGPVKRFYPQFTEENGKLTALKSDVAMFFHGRNPFNATRTLTLCNGMLGRGTYAIVRALTDPRFRDRNHEYLQSRFKQHDDFGIVTKIDVISNAAVTPDWNSAQNRLYEWPPATS
jgi:transcriptional regulator with XRE-family HTH domain